MPPKKAATAEKKVWLGRPSNNLQIGIVGKSPLSRPSLRRQVVAQIGLGLTTPFILLHHLGMPNVGKSSLFNIISKCDLGKIANFPYATIEPEEARVAVPDERFDWLCDVYKPSSKVPAFLTCVDIAGLTKGASTGAGLGNNFLANVRAVDGIFQVVRAFDDAEVIHVEGDVDPIRDMEIIRDELRCVQPGRCRVRPSVQVRALTMRTRCNRLKDIEWVEKKHDALKKALRGATGTANLADKAKKEELDCVAKVLDVLTVQNKDVRKATWSNKEIDIVNDLLLLTAKPVTYLVNLSEKDYIRKKNKWLPKIKAWIDENNPGDLLIPFSIALEERVAQEFADEVAQKAEFEKLGTQGQLGKITTAGYASLHLIRYFTCGPQEVRAWTIREGTKAPQAAGVIHGDFEKNFSECRASHFSFWMGNSPIFDYTVCGEIMSYADLKEYGTEAAVKAAGKMMQKGKPYEIVDGDIC
ncbi:BZ3500_MvSof-1268-A1-R1_Chr3-3g06382 [Microbotryum saponariae]|uniref:BZ3500_MvSof-1268-A1-R1_Chr3-3g06382 protein n=1 Tax=Microbotryum saponariae TaxID=289078 RepID=A0A2X0MZN4_9BASI|nr:BZ3500_MvSof-1268-A1-R1_Chr3-3g06382 [Microbotryum saponariae]SDA04349.1 BZ3501_MvSof-1269-A2-R1_Chr3-2g06069 [Microbotryum saponariae]